MYLNNKYTKTYYNIVNRASQRTLDGYTETHHIIPRSLGGSDDPNNLVVLTAREHFLCHWLLTKMVKGKRKQWSMINALGMMMWSENDNQERYRINARLYEQLKQKHSDMKSWAMTGERNPQYGKKWSEERKQAFKEKRAKQAPMSEEAREKIRQSRLGKTWDDDYKKRMSDIKKVQNAGENNPMYGKTHSDETRRKQSDAAKGRKYSAETIEKRAAKIRGKKRPTLTCPHCNSTVAVNTYARWHGDQCKIL
jgi:ribosomal protein L37AE/L43A